MSSFVSKTNLAALKTEVDKIDVDKLNAVPIDLAKLTNAVENDLVKKTAHNTKVTSIEGQLAGITKNTIDNLADITKLKAIDTNSFVLKTKLASDVTTLENKIDTVDTRNVLIFGADISFSVHATNRANHIYLMGTGLIQRINDTTIYAEKNFYKNFTDFGKKFMFCLHYNGDDSYLFVNGRQDLKFKAKTDQLVKEKLCIGNLSDQWTTSESEKTGVYGKIYDFVVHYEQIACVKTIYDMHRYLMTKHNISP